MSTRWLKLLSAPQLVAKNILQMIYPITMLAIAVLLAIEFSGSKREERKDFVIAKIKFDGKEPIYKISLGESPNGLMLIVPKKIYDEATTGRPIAYSFRRGRTGFDAANL